MKSSNILTIIILLNVVLRRRLVRFIG